MKGLQAFGIRVQGSGFRDEWALKPATTWRFIWVVISGVLSRVTMDITGDKLV